MKNKRAFILSNCLRVHCNKPNTVVIPPTRNLVKSLALILNCCNLSIGSNEYVISCCD